MQNLQVVMCVYGVMPLSKPVTMKSQRYETGHQPEKKSTKREEKEQEVDDIFQDLKERHDSDYSGPQLRLWARMISNGLHEDLDNPPRVPMITGTTPKRPKQDTLTEALTIVATVFAKMINPPSSGQSVGATSSTVGMQSISPQEGQSRGVARIF